MKWIRYFDLEYWQMREALGFPIPAWVDRRWPRKFQGNVGKNPFWPGPEAAKVALTRQAQELGMGY